MIFINNRDVLILLYWLVCLDWAFQVFSCLHTTNNNIKTKIPLSAMLLAVIISMIIKGPFKREYAKPHVPKTRFYHHQNL